MKWRGAIDNIVLFFMVIIVMILDKCGRNKI